MPMRGLTTLYLYACEEQGCESNSALVRYFHSLDTMDAAAGELVPAACPTTLDLSANYLGDAGTAACFRVLTLMRWVRKVNARGVGAGPRAVRALCEVLTTAFPQARQPLDEHEGSNAAAGDDNVTADTMTHSHNDDTDNVYGMLNKNNKDTHALIELEEVDLRENGIYAESGQRLVRALQQRLRLAARWHGTSTKVETTLVVHVDLDKLPATTAASLAALNAASEAVRAREAAQRRRQAIAERLRLFCTPTGQPMGEQLVFRIPLYQSDSMCTSTQCEDTTPLYDCSNASLVTLVTEVNRVMEEYLAAYGAFTALHTAQRGTCREQKPVVPHRAVAQLCLELGPDMLPLLLTRTDARVWQGMRHNHSETKSEDLVNVEDAVRDKSQREKCWACGVAVARAAVAALLRGFCANPFLAEELSASRGSITQHYLDRLRALYYTTPSSDGDDDEKRIAEMIALYHRLVAALVTQPMSDLPSMSAVEERLRAIRAEMMSPLLTASEMRPHAIQKRLLMAEYDETLGESSARTTKTVDSKSIAEPGPWSLWCSQLKYLRYNHAEEVARWNEAYSITSCDVAVGGADKQEDEEEETLCDALATCTCAQQHVVEGESVLSRPCPACCQAALRAMLAVLNDAHAVQRLALLGPLRAALPRELRYFFLDLVIRHCSNECMKAATGGCGCCVYVPTLFGQPGSLAQAGNSDVNKQRNMISPKNNMLSIVDCLAAVDGQPARMSELLSAFEEWYRLRMLESMDATGAMNLFETTALSA